MRSMFFRASSPRSSASRQNTRYSATDVESSAGAFCSASSTASASSYAAAAYRLLARTSVSSLDDARATPPNTPAASTTAVRQVLVKFMVPPDYARRLVGWSGVIVARSNREYKTQSIRALRGATAGIKR
jgi:hypothetical protein